MTSHTPLRLPESMTRDDIGPYMRGLREHFALSQQDVSERLHIRHRYIDAIELGAFESMPGRAYAKGYVHTYAEFLGLDADQVVEICFGPELVRDRQRHYVPEPQKRVNTGKKNFGHWRSLAMLGVVAAILLLAVVQFTGGEDDEGSTETVSEVPEDMLNDMRTLLMPTGMNYDCLGHESELGCLQDSVYWNQLLAMTQAVDVYLAEAAYADSLAEEEEKPAKKSKKKKAEDDEEAE